MRNIYRSVSAVVLVLALALPAGAASRVSRPFSFLQVLKRFIIQVATRTSPPVGSPIVEPPPPPPEEETTTGPTDAPVQSQ